MTATSTSTSTSTITSTITSIETMNAFLGSVTAAQTEALKKAMRGQTLQDAHACFLKTENKALGLIGAYSATFQAIAQTLCYGQTTGLKGLSLASKRQSGAFAALVQHGIVSESGTILIGLDPEVGKHGKAQYGALMAHELSFVAALWAAREAQRETEAAARKAKADAKPEATETETEPEAPKAEATPGQLDDAAVQRIVASFIAGQLSNDNLTAILAAFAPHGVKAAPKVKASTMA